MAQRDDIQKDAIALLQQYQQAQRPAGTLRYRVVGGLVGGIIGAMFGFAVLLFVAGWLFGGNAQTGLAAVFLGVPCGGWLGGRLGSKWASEG